MVKRKYLCSFILIIIGLLLIGYGFMTHYHFYKDKNNYINESKKEIIKYYDDTSIKDDITDNTDKSIEINDINDNVNNVFAVISIPKINLEKSLYNIDSTENNVKYNVEILKGSTMPNELYSHLFLASHSGSNYNAYFNNLSKLELNDEIYLLFNGVKYTYEVNSIFEVEKDGKIEINDTNNVKMLTLITCHIGTNKQIVVNSYLINEEIY